MFLLYYTFSNYKEIIIKRLKTKMGGGGSSRGVFDTPMEHVNFKNPYIRSQQIERSASYPIVSYCRGRDTAVESESF